MAQPVSIICRLHSPDLSASIHMNSSSFSSLQHACKSHGWFGWSWQPRRNTLPLDNVLFESWSGKRRGGGLLNDAVWPNRSWLAFASFSVFWFISRWKMPPVPQRSCQRYLKEKIWSLELSIHSSVSLGGREAFLQENNLESLSPCWTRPRTILLHISPHHLLKWFKLAIINYSDL